MNRNGNFNFGRAAAYRSRAEIKEDIRLISERIAAVNDSLNVRELISDIFNEENSADMIKKAESITELLKYAEEALSELRELNDQLDELKAELLSSVDMCACYERGGM